MTKEKIEVDLTFSADKDVDKFTDQQRKNQQRKANRELGLGQRGYRGWRNNTTLYEVRNTYSIEGSIKTQKGEASQTWKKTFLEKEIKKSKNTLKYIDSLKQNIDKFTNFLTVGHSHDKFKILKLEVIYPEIKINGNYELSHNDDFKLYRKFGGRVSASPLFGLSLKLDVIQIVATFLKINTSVSILREVGELYEEKVKKGEHGVQSGGLNATAFLENGTNTIELLFKDRTSEKSNKFDPNARCETTLKKVSAFGDEEIISHVKLTVDKEGNTLTSESLNQIGRTGSEFAFTGMATTPGDKGFYKARKSFSLNGLPDWMWTKARPVTENDLPAIKNFYQEIINVLAHKDLDKLWKKK
ncbi:hypothetical protein Xmau_00774 [Xenorhabdus mauleonii]|uniref:Uncharacterized protein n=1 Tax=Xenorhabdus mauleonii TaxID=351675 RepID=A0A1I3RY73_9GAMM|nr:hypothetical protein [Xenorhabdus mauleonii]PHM46364.1 hypothetical protein Xmau_00774 [Xenorhabdus mauleonii]SFJ51574.1 hypothetical protein SAMN05421680_110118 [Xenorhabdus mauleonii]